MSGSARSSLNFSWRTFTIFMPFIHHIFYSLLSLTILYTILTHFPSCAIRYTVDPIYSEFHYKLMIGAEKPVHYKRIFTITESTINGIDCICISFLLVIECPQLSNDEDLYLRVSDHNRTYGSRAHFSCSTGYKLIGPDFVTCLKNSSWSDDTPHCEGINYFLFTPFYST